MIFLIYRVIAILSSDLMIVQKKYEFHHRLNTVFKLLFVTVYGLLF